MFYKIIEKTITKNENIQFETNMRKSIVIRERKEIKRGCNNKSRINARDAKMNSRRLIEKKFAILTVF